MWSRSLKHERCRRTVQLQLERRTGQGEHDGGVLLDGDLGQGGQGAQLQRGGVGLDAMTALIGSRTAEYVTPLTLTVTLSLVTSSWSGTMSATVRRLVRTIRSRIGRTRMSPGPFAPVSRPSRKWTARSYSGMTRSADNMRSAIPARSAPRMAARVAITPALPYPSGSQRVRTRPERSDSRRRRTRNGRVGSVSWEECSSRRRDPDRGFGHKRR